MITCAMFYAYFSLNALMLSLQLIKLVHRSRFGFVDVEVYYYALHYAVI